MQTMLNCIDNSGAAVVECVQVMKMKRAAKIGLLAPLVYPWYALTGCFIGDRIIVVVQKQRSFGPEASSTSIGITNKVRRGDIRHAVVVRARKELQRPDGSVVNFDDNACVLINKTGDPIGTRLNGMTIYTSLLSWRWR